MCAPILTIGLCLQPFVLDSIKSNKIFKGRGLLARFLFSICKPQAGYRMRIHSVISKEVSENYISNILQLLDIPRFEVPIELSLSKEASVLWDHFYNECELLMRAGNPLESLRDLGSKIPGNTARISGLLHAAANVNVTESKIISENTMKSAIMIGKYFRDHGQYAFAGKDSAILSAKKLLEYIDTHKPDSFKSRDIMRSKNYFDSVDQIKPGIKLLIKKNIIKEQEFIGSTVRNQATVYIVNPKYNLLKTIDNIDMTFCNELTYTEPIVSD